MSFNVNLPLGRSNSMSGLSGLRITSKDPSAVLSISYDKQDRPLAVEYTLVDGTNETVTVSYSDDGFLRYNGVEYRCYYLDVFSAAIVRCEEDSTRVALLQQQAQIDATDDLLIDIRGELKKLNMYFALITNTRI